MAKREGLFITDALRKLFEAEGELRDQLGIEAEKFFAEWEADKENETLHWTSMKVTLSAASLTIAKPRILWRIIGRSGKPYYYERELFESDHLDLARKELNPDQVSRIECLVELDARVRELAPNEY